VIARSFNLPKRVPHSFTYTWYLRTVSAHTQGMIFGVIILW